MIEGLCRSTLRGSIALCPHRGRLRRGRRSRVRADDGRRSCSARRTREERRLGAGTTSAAQARRSRDRAGPPRSRTGTSQSAVRSRACPCGLDDPVRLAAVVQRRGLATRPLARGHRGRRRQQPCRLGRRTLPAACATSEHDWSSMSIFRLGGSPSGVTAPSCAGSASESAAPDRRHRPDALR